MDAPFDSMAAAQQEAPKHPDPSFAVKSTMADGDMVAVHTEVLGSKSKPSEGGLRQVHLFRFGKDGKVVEYWDITQMIQPDMPNAANAF
jgi:predicted SnoaL-like aldol condensation-catalyzing enzyme